VILYDLSYSYRNYVLTLSDNNPKLNLIGGDDYKIFCTSGPSFDREGEDFAYMSSDACKLISF